MRELADRLWTLREPPAEVLAGRAATLGLKGTAAIIDRAAPTPLRSRTGFQSTKARASSVSEHRRAEDGIEGVHALLAWMASEPSTSEDDGKNTVNTRWSDIVDSDIVKAAAMRAFVRFGAAEDALAVAPDEDTTALPVAVARLDALASLRSCERAAALMARLESDGLLTYLPQDRQNGNTVDDGERSVMRAYTAAIRACVGCQRTAVSLLFRLESVVMEAHRSSSLRGVAVMTREAQEMLHAAQAAAIDACAATGDWETALGILRMAQDRAAQEGVVIRGKRRKRRLRRMRKSPAPVHTLANGRTDDIDSFLYGCVSDEMYISAIRACGAGRAWMRAMAVVEDAEQCGVSTPDFYATAIDAIENVQRNDSVPDSDQDVMRAVLCEKLRSEGRL